MLGRLAFSQSITQLQKKANDLFDKQDYSSALVDFRQLLAQNPISMDFNYKYGICLFYSDNRKNAKRYFDFVMRQNTCPSETYYYVAKLYHYDYKFSSAIDYYQKYLDNTPEKLRSKNVVNDIQQCKNGKLLLQNPTALRIINANRFSISKFYLNYDLQSRTGGFFTNEELQSKIDKKNNFLPMYYFSRGDSLKFFASYGTNNNKDIYFSVKNGVDLWSTATKISGDVNTSFDEDYPFFDAQKGLLYFSSMGHNSIGGYDLFQVAFNPIENVAQEISNLDFPYSSADDDFLFVPEENQKTAYFSSNRNCEKNKIDVYLVENGKKKSTIQLIKGDFHDLVDEKNKLAQIKVVDVNSGEEFGPFTTDDNGNYSIILPGGGKYKFMVTVEGSRKLFENIMLVPQINNTRKLAQTLRYSVQDSDEFLEFINNFNDDQLASDEDKMLVLSAIASLKMNPSLIQNDPKLIDELENTSSVLKELGFINPDEKEALSMLNDELLSIELIEEELSNALTNAISIQNENNKALLTINNTIQEIKAELSDASLTFDKKMELLELVLNLQKDKIVLQEQLVAMNNVIIENEKALNLNVNSAITKNAAEINEKVLTLSLMNNKDSIDVFLLQNKDKIKSLLLNKTVIENTNDDAVDSLEKELLAITKGLFFERNDLKTKKDSINLIIQELTERKELANKKDQLVISDQIIREQKKAEILENDKLTSITSLVNNEKKIIREIANIQVKIDLSQSNYKAGEEQIDISKVKALTISEDDMSALYQEKNDVENSISIIESNNKERIALNKKIDEVILLKDDTIKYKSLLILLSNKEKALKSEIEDAQKSNNFLLLNNYSEELQVLQSLQNKYTEELALNEIESKTLQPTKEDPVIVSKETVEAELALESAKTKTTYPVIVSKETVEAELALESAKTKTTDPVIVSKETVEAELALEEAKTKTPDPVIVSKETVEAELALEAAKTKTPDPVIVSKETVEAELALEAAKTKTPDPVIVSKETVEAELALEGAKTKTTDPVIVSKETVEAELALESTKTKATDPVIVSKETVEAELALEATKTKTTDPVIVSEETVDAGQKENPALILDNNSSYSSAIEKQLQQFNSEIPNDLILSFNETRKLEQQILTDKDLNNKESGSQVVKVLDATNNLIASQLILSSKINALEDEFPILKESYDKNDIINALVLQKEVLETAKINEPSIGTELINKAIAIINNEVIQRTSESQELSKEIPFKFANTQQATEAEKVALSKDPGYYEYLKLRTAYNQMAHTRDSLQYEIALNKQKLDAMMNENNRVASVSESEHELAKLLNEQLRSLNDYSEKLESQGTIITNLANQPEMEAMLLDKIQPLQLTKSQTNYDFKIDAKQTNTSSVYLPILSESPSGLIYRVQLGAFKKPVSIDKFREFSPVSGEVLANGLTCYLAGFFNNATIAINARKEIRNFGYADAFIVAYCDGKRISLAEAKELERLGRCVPKSQNELSIDVARLFETAEKNTNENLSIENQDVFYTVQVGVYNKKINNEQLLGIEELDAYQAPNGQYRYSSGKFLSLEDAKNRKVSVISKGITDAYIVAYSNGKRIDINAATALLQQNNRTPELNKNRNLTLAAIDFSKLEASLEPPINYIQFTKNVDAGITNDLLGISNKGGTFIFNPTQKHVISGYIDVNTITAFERIFYADMTMESKIKTSKVCSVYATNSTIKSAVHDWLLHCNIPYTIIAKSNAIEIQFVILQNSSIEEIELMANKYDYVLKINEL